MAFFVLGSAVSRLKNLYKKQAETLQDTSGPRNWKQVLCNSLPACVLLWIWVFYPRPGLLLLSFGVFSAAAADTFSSELGMMSKGRVYNILSGKPMQRGLSGGVSLAGTLAGLAGSLLLALLALPRFGWKGVLISTALGFAGSVIDSTLGAAFQRKYAGADGKLSEKPCSCGERPLYRLPFCHQQRCEPHQPEFGFLWGRFGVFHSFRIPIKHDRFGCRRK